MSETLAAPGGGESVLVEAAFPGEALIGDEGPGEAQLGVGGDGEPGPEVALFGGAHTRGGRVEGLLGERKVFDVETADVAASAHIEVRHAGAGPP